MTKAKTMTEAKIPEAKLDETIEDSFPASDPSSHTPATGVRASTADTAAAKTAQAEDRDDATPTGLPNSDRHAAEITAGRIDNSNPPQAKYK